MTTVYASGDDQAGGAQLPCNIHTMNLFPSYNPITYSSQPSPLWGIVNRTNEMDILSKIGPAENPISLSSRTKFGLSLSEIVMIISDMAKVILVCLVG